VAIRGEALANETGSADFHVPAFTGSGGGSLQNLHPEEGQAKTFKVSTIKLDSLGLEGLDVMKVDVEGAELGVILGGLSTISSSYPTIFIELLRKWMRPFGSSPSQVSDRLIELGYEIFEMHESFSKLVPVLADNTDATNFVFVHKSRKNHFNLIKSFSLD
jgi:hypothetical protein